MQKMYRTPKYVSEANFSLDDLEASKVPNTGKIWAQIEQTFLMLQAHFLQHKVK